MDFLLPGAYRKVLDSSTWKQRERKGPREKKKRGLDPRGRHNGRAGHCTRPYAMQLCNSVTPQLCNSVLSSNCKLQEQANTSVQCPTSRCNDPGCPYTRPEGSPHTPPLLICSTENRIIVPLRVMKVLELQQVPSKLP